MVTYPINGIFFIMFRQWLLHHFSSPLICLRLHLSGVTVTHSCKNVSTNKNYTDCNGQMVAYIHLILSCHPQMYTLGLTYPS